jgi:hypothetical protein
MADVDFWEVSPFRYRRNQNASGNEYAEEAFSKLLRPLYPSGATLQILDAGCGLAFLTYLAAECFPKASITGVDLFRHSSVSELPIDKAVKNMKSLGMDPRTSFLKHDLTKPLKSDLQYDLALSKSRVPQLGKEEIQGIRNCFRCAQTRRVCRHRGLVPTREGRYGLLRAVNTDR